MFAYKLNGGTVLRHSLRVSLAVATLAAALLAAPAMAHATGASDQDAYCNYEGSIVPGKPRDLQALDQPPVANRSAQTFSFRTGLCFGTQYKRESVVLRWVGTGRTFAQVESEIARRPDAFHVFSAYRDGNNVLVANNYYRSTS